MLKIYRIPFELHLSNEFVTVSLSQPGIYFQGVKGLRSDLPIK